ncbi:DJ-1 family glyoxalase III [Clostridium sp. WILCCON 0269]|uniref:DJ-1 family glyoxalase III n=1 Tax=Candidatus Clostridium eludens TaxID=3381663 RepID=A0ABW8SM24_9CLOT
MKKAVVLLAEGFEEIEALTCVDVLRRANIHCITCSINSKKDVTGAHGISVNADSLLEAVNVDEYHAVILPGGMPGTINLRDDEKVIEFIKKLHTENKIVAAICAAPIVLKKAGIIEGKKVTSYPGFEEELASDNYSEESVVQEGNLITSRGPATAIYFVFKILENLVDKNIVENLKKDMLLDLVKS